MAKHKRVEFHKTNLGRWYITHAAPTRSGRGKRPGAYESRKVAWHADRLSDAALTRLAAHSRETGRPITLAAVSVEIRVKKLAERRG